MRKLFKNSKLAIWLSLGLSLVAVFVCAVSTLTWFQIDSQPIKTDIVSSSPDITIDNDNVYGYKIKPTLNEYGQIDYSNEAVTKVKSNASTIDSVTNDDLEGADTNFDVPDGGIGYYLVNPSSTGGYKFPLSDEYKKFTEYNGGMSFIDQMYFETTGELIKIRSYQMTNTSETSLTDVTVSKITYNGVEDTNDDYLNNGKIKIPTSGTYEVWFDTNNQKVGLKFLSASDLTRVTPRNDPYKLHGTDTFYFNSNGMYNQGSEYTYVYLFGTGGNNTWPGVQMTWVTGNIFKVNVDTSQYQTAIFCRVSKDGNKTVWNQTVDITIPTDIYGGNNCWKVTTWNGSGNKETGSYETYSSRTYDVKVSYNNGSQTSMTLESGTSYYKTYASAATNATLKFYINGEIINTTADAGSGFNLNNVTSTSSNSTRTIKYGNSRSVTVYLDISTQKVWVSTVYELCVAGSTKYPMSRIESGDGDYDSSWRQYRATYSGTAGQAITVLVNGVSTSYTRDSDTYNNLNASNQLAKDATSESAYLKFGDSDANPTFTTAKSRLYLAGNKTYELTVGGSTYEMVYNSAAGDYHGWYKYTLSSLASGATGYISLNGSKITTNIAKSTNTGNSISTVSSGTITWCSSGVTATGITVYYNTASPYHVYSDPIYTIKIGNTTKFAPYNSTDGIYEVASSFTFDSHIAITAKLNGGSNLTLTRKADDGSSKNNIETSPASGTTLYTYYGATDTAYLSISGSTNYIWVEGYSPSYCYKIGNGSWTAFSSYNDSTSTATVSITSAAAGATIQFARGSTYSPYTTYNSSVSKHDDVLNNITGSTGSLTIVSQITSARTLTLNWSTNKAYLGGRAINYYWYNGDPNLSATTQFKAFLWQEGSGTIKNAEYPGVNMTNPTSDTRLWKVTFYGSNTPGGNYDHVIFNYGTSTASKAYQTVDIAIDVSNNNKYCNADNYLGDTVGGLKKWNVHWYSNLPSTAADYSFYIQDSNNYFSASPVYAYAWSASGSYMQNKGAGFPGVATDTIIAGSLYKFTCADEYDKMLFTNASGSRQTDDFTNIGSHNGGLWVANGYSSKVTGDWQTLKVVSFGTAVVQKSTNGSPWSTIATMHDGDLTINDYMYELGVQVTHNDYLQVVVNGSTTYNSYNSLVGDKSGLTGTASTIRASLGTVGATARFNFYVTHSGQLSIAMVPDLGNGFYIMHPSDNGNGVHGFVKGIKMNTSSSTSAIYSGYYATANETIFIRSYIDAVDIQYSTRGSGSASSITVDGSGKFTFHSEGYYDIEVANNKVTITEYSWDSFFALNPLNVSNVANSNAIKNQHTSFVLEVPFYCNNSYDSNIELYFANTLSNYVGASVCVITSATKESLDVSPYNYARTTCYESLSNSNTSSDVNNTTIVADYDATSYDSEFGYGHNLYYAYILVDYLPTSAGANYSTFNANASYKLTFYLKSKQKTA